MPRWLQTAWADAMSQQTPAESFMVTPSTAYPCCLRSAAVVELSTPPLMATRTRFDIDIINSTTETQRHREKLVEEKIQDVRERRKLDI
jgi:hypothetical protein